MKPISINKLQRELGQECKGKDCSPVYEPTEKEVEDYNNRLIENDTANKENWRNNGSPKQTYRDFSGAETSNFKPEYFPINIFPEEIKNIILQLEEVMGFQIQTTSAGILFTVSVAVGTHRILHVKEGWNSMGSLWLNIVGATGTNKTHPVAWAIKPITQKETEAYAIYKEEKELWDKKSGKPPPKRMSRYTTDSTVEGIVKRMSSNPVGVGYHTDELKGLFESFNQYKGKGSDQTFYMSGFNNDSYSTSRSIADEYYISTVYIPMIGGIQPSVLRGIAAENTDNGMLQRWLYIENKREFTPFSSKDMPKEAAALYARFINRLYDESMEVYDGVVKIVHFTNESRKLFAKTMNMLVGIQEADDSNDILIAYVSKLQTYYPKFVNIISAMWQEDKVSESTIYKADHLLDYFLESAKSLFINLDEQKNINIAFSDAKAKTVTDKINVLLDKFPEMTTKKIAEHTGSSPQFVNRVKGKKKIRKAVP